MWRAQASALRKRVLRSPPRPRRFLHPGVSVDAFLSELTRKGARYAALRWFESLPAVDEGEDIDLLISDEDLAIIEPMLTPYQPFPATQKVDLYTVSGLRGTDYKGVPYFSKLLATRVLDNTVLMHGKYRVPAPAAHLDSLAFHAVYHKGEGSGLPPSKEKPASLHNPDHDYRAVLERLSAQVGEDVEVTLEGLDRFLSARGLRPAADLLDRYQTRNPWLRDQLAGERPEIGAAAGLVTFVVRDRAMAYIDAASAVIERHGFELLHTAHLTIEEKLRVREAVRGGNWACGPFPQSGGDPAAIIVAYDFSYRPAAGADGQLINENAAFTKGTIRKLIDSDHPRSERFNPMHSTDNGWQSLDCLRALDRDRLFDDVLERIAGIERKMELPWPVVGELSVSARRARVLVVDHPVHGKSVVKVFRPGAARFFERELKARQLFEGVACVPALLEHGENWVLTPLYSDTHAHVRRKLPRSRQVQLTYEAMLSLSAFVTALRGRDHFLLDLSTHNLVSDPDAGLKILDFEFLQPYAGKAPTLERDYTILGASPDPGVDGPVFKTPNRWDVSVRSSVFHPAICGLPARRFFGRTNSGLRLEMGILQLFWWVVFDFQSRFQSLIRRPRARAVVRVLRRLSGSRRAPGTNPAKPLPARVGGLQHP